MTVEFVLLLALYAFIVMRVFLVGDSSPIETFKNSGPRLAARIERNITTGRGFQQNKHPNGAALWSGPEGGP